MSNREDRRLNDLVAVAYALCIFFCAFVLLLLFSSLHTYIPVQCDWGNKTSNKFSIHTINPSIIYMWLTEAKQAHTIRN